MTDDTYKESSNLGSGEAKLTEDVTEAHLRAEVRRLTAERDALRVKAAKAHYLSRQHRLSELCEVFWDEKYKLTQEQKPAE